MVPFFIFIAIGFFFPWEKQKKKTKKKPNKQTKKKTHQQTTRKKREQKPRQSLKPPAERSISPGSCTRTTPGTTTRRPAAAAPRRSSQTPSQVAAARSEVRSLPPATRYLKRNGTFHRGVHLSVVLESQLGSKCALLPRPLSFRSSPSRSGGGTDEPSGANSILLCESVFGDPS